jgi:hypothetical protein
MSVSTRSAGSPRHPDEAGIASDLWKCAGQDSNLRPAT